MPVKAKVVGPAFDWNGVYVGAYAGAVWMDRATATDPCRVAFLAFCAAVGVGTFNRARPTGYDMNPSFLAGGTIGVNWQPDRVYDHPHAGNSNHQPRPELLLPLSVWQGRELCRPRVRLRGLAFPRCFHICDVAPNASPPA